MQRGMIAVALAALAGCTATQAPTDAVRTYGSATYGFAFDVPAPYAAKEDAPGALSVGRPAPGGFESVADVRLTVAGEGEDYSSFETYALAKLRTLCAADGPGETISCGEAQQRQPFVTASGLEGEALYLARLHETFATGAVARDGFGPVFLFDVSDEVPGDGWAALAVQPPASLPASEVDSALLRRIAESLSMGAARPGS